MALILVFLSATESLHASLWVDASRCRKTGLKIVHVETGRSFYGGPQQVIWLIRGLSAHDVTSILVCPPGSEIDAVARDAGIQVMNLPCAGDADFLFPIRLHRLLRRVAPDIVHIHSRRGADFPGGWGALTARVPALASRRVDSMEAPTAAAIRYWPFRKIVAISENIATVLGISRVPPNRLTVIRDAVDIDSVVLDAARETLPREFGIEKEDFAIAVVAQLIKRKGHRFLLDVLPGLVNEHPNIKVVFFGAGNAEEQLRALARRLAVLPRSTSPASDPTWTTTCPHSICWFILLKKRVWASRCSRQRRHGCR